ncbi:MAG: tRNA lysidine(34) synthetase TilS [gamma proteobacterium symbiont of Bathyaustriella thionipta]|nr:tRNA lysidine(34) synthetase TilS [gamma proteobacterium symbiont of Bathyaustriella thionipta]
MVNSNPDGGPVSAALEHFLAQQQYCNGQIFIAYSGGLDSSVLLHAASHLAHPPENLKAIHIHHGLSQQADQWQQHCQNQCEQWSVRCRVRRVKVDRAHSQGLEAAAREVRYRVFSEFVEKNDLLLSAHHQDDQAETLLLQLMRGSGVNGLSAMPVITSFGQGQLGRPFLDCSRATLEQYARLHNLRWIEDDSNSDLRFDRNYVRAKLMPVLRERWPAGSKTIARSARLCAAAASQIKQQARQDSEQICHAAALDISRLNALMPARRDSLLRFWLTKRGLPIPSEKVLRRVLQEACQARADATPLVAWPGAEARRHQNKLYLMPPLPAAWHESILWSQTEQLLTINRIVTLRQTRVKGKGIALHHWDAASRIEVRFRQGGEICDLPARGRRELKRLLHEADIAAWLRAYIPMIYLDGKLAWVAGIGTCQAFCAAAESQAMGFSMQWHKPLDELIEIKSI